MGRTILVEFTVDEATARQIVEVGALGEWTYLAVMEAIENALAELKQLDDLVNAENWVQMLGRYTDGHGLSFEEEMALFRYVKFHRPRQDWEAFAVRFPTRVAQLTKRGSLEA